MLKKIEKYLKRLLPQSIQKAKKVKKFYRKLPPKIVDVMANLKKSDIVLDLGANVGFVSEIFAKKGAIVYAYEPDPHVFGVLAKMAQRYENRIIAVQAAVGCEDKQAVALYFHHDYNQNKEKFSEANSLLADIPQLSANKIEVPCVDLTRIIAQFEKVQIIKMDIEGYETVVVPHLIESGALDKVSYVFVETHERLSASLAEATERMKKKASESRYRDKIFFDWP